MTDAINSISSVLRSHAADGEVLTAVDFKEHIAQPLLKKIDNDRRTRDFCNHIQGVLSISDTQGPATIALCTDFEQLHNCQHNVAKHGVM